MLKERPRKNRGILISEPCLSYGSEKHKHCDRLRVALGNVDSSERQKEFRESRKDLEKIVEMKIITV
jgi:hypothetical protein